MKDIVQENLTYLFDDYCRYIDKQDLESVEEAEKYKNSFRHFMLWLNGFLMEKPN